MILLQLAQMSEAEQFADRKWVNGLITSKSFDEVAAKYPECMINLEDAENSYPNWGYGWYQRGENNVIELYKQNWDTSG